MPADGSGETHEEREHWVTTRYEMALDSILGLRCEVDQERQALNDWEVTVRGRPAYSSPPEYLLTLVKRHSGRVEGSFATLSEPLAEQLQRQHTASPEADLAEVIRRIDIRRVELPRSGSLPPLRTLASRFEHLELRLALDSSMFLDSRQYELCVVAGSQRLWVSLLGPSSGDSRDPVVAWVERVRRAFAEDARRIYESPRSP